MTGPFDEKTLAVKCAAGDNAARKQFFMMFFDDLLILCSRYFPDRDQAREAQSLGIKKCFKQMNGFEYRGEGSLKAWTCRLIVNVCLSRLEVRKWKFSYVEIDPTIPTDATVYQDMAEKELLSLVQRLAPGFRTVFNLFVFDDFSHREIAQMLGIAEQTSRSQLARAKRDMRKMVEHLYQTNKSYESGTGV